MSMAVYENAAMPTLITLSGSLIFLRPLRQKAWYPILLTLFGISISIRPEQFSNAHPAIPNVPSSTAIDVFLGIVPLYPYSTFPT